MARETSPCRADTALARRDSFSPSTVMQNSSCGLCGFSRPKRHQVVRARGRADRAAARGAPRSGSAWKRSWPAGTGVCVVKTTSRATRGTASSKPMPSSSMRLRIASSTAKPLWPFVQVQHARGDAHGPQRAEAADAQQQLLADADAAVAAVEARRQLAVLRRVALDVGIEQQQVAAADLHAPDLGANGAAARLDLAPSPARRFRRWPAPSAAGWRRCCRYSSCCQPLRSSRWRK